jgi:hypothetical protein
MAGPPGWGLGVGLTTLPCKKKIVVLVAFYDMNLNIFGEYKYYIIF